MPSFNEWLFGKPDKLKKVDTGTKQQQQFGGQDLIQMLQDMINPGGGLQQANQYDKSLLGEGPEAFNKFSQPYLQQFNEQIIPGIEERYAGGGALSSSGFGQALGGASAGLQSQLAQLFSQLQGQAAGRQQGQFQNLSQVGLGYSPFAYQNEKGSGGAFGPLMTSLVEAFGPAAINKIGQGFDSLIKPQQPGTGLNSSSSQSNGSSKSSGSGGFGLPNFLQR
jgi:hypothetical protein